MLLLAWLNFCLTPGYKPRGVESKGLFKINPVEITNNITCKVSFVSYEIIVFVFFCTEKCLRKFVPLLCICFLIGWEHIRCHLPKLKIFLGCVKFTHIWLDRVPSNCRKYLTSQRSGSGIMTGPTGNSEGLGGKKSVFSASQ